MFSLTAFFFFFSIHFFFICRNGSFRVLLSTVSGTTWVNFPVSAIVSEEQIAVPMPFFYRESECVHCLDVLQLHCNVFTPHKGLLNLTVHPFVHSRIIVDFIVSNISSRPFTLFFLLTLLVELCDRLS